MAQAVVNNDKKQNGKATNGSAAKKEAKKEKKDKKEKSTNSVTSSLSVVTSSSSIVSSSPSAVTSSSSVAAELPRDAIQVQVTMRRLDATYAYMRPSLTLFGLPVVLSLETRSAYTSADLSAMVWARVAPLVELRNSGGEILTPVTAPFTLCTVNSTCKWVIVIHFIAARTYIHTRAHTHTHAHAHMYVHAHVHHTTPISKGTRTRTRTRTCLFTLFVVSSQCIGLSGDPNNIHTLRNYAQSLSLLGALSNNHDHTFRALEIYR